MHYMIAIPDESSDFIFYGEPDVDGEDVTLEYVKRFTASHPDWYPVIIWKSEDEWAEATAQ